MDVDEITNDDLGQNESELISSRSIDTHFIHGFCLYTIGRAYSESFSLCSWADRFGSRASDGFG